MKLLQHIDWNYLQLHYSLPTYDSDKNYEREKKTPVKTTGETFESLRIGTDELHIEAEEREKLERAFRLRFRSSVH